MIKIILVYITILTSLFALESNDRVIFSVDLIGAVNKEKLIDSTYNAKSHDNDLKIGIKRMYPAGAIVRISEITTIGGYPTHIRIFPTDKKNIPYWFEIKFEIKEDDYEIIK